MAKKNFILVCGGTGCESAKSDEIYRNLIKEAELQGVKDDVQIVKTGCFGFCEQGPIVKVLPTDSFYVQVKPQDAAEIISEQVIKGREVTRLLYKKDKKTQDNVKVQDIEFYQKQFRIVLRNCGVINPENIEEYIARDGYMALEKALFELKPQQIIDIVKASGLRGRGGAGFPTGLKWETAAKVKSDVKYIVCNADEGDPGAYMDRSTIEGDPHSILEAMMIAGKAVGSTKGYIYIRAEYPLAIERLKVAIEQAKAMGLMGDKILGSDFSFDVEIRLGAGAFVCGEETALLKSIEGNRGMPIPKPPFPAIKGLWDKPTIINNVETLANIPVILTKGAEWFSSIGTEKSKGTKVFALTGKINNSGLIEVPMGTTLREIIFDIGGGIRNGRKFKGVQTGGPSGGIIVEKDLDTPISYESLVALGSMMGSGGMIVMDEDDCVVDVSKFYMEFCVDESCGKCAPCRIGTNQMQAILSKISKGKGEEADLDRLERIGKAMTKASLCMLGGSAANPTMGTLRHFREEYLEHIRDHKCRAGKCKDLVVYSIDPEKCIGCGLCARKCPVPCIAGEKKQPHVIDASRCIKCGECFKVCKFGAVLVR
ncbi:MAG: NADH-quinone oxidoreductase subunit NuoF [Spirochaetia bacterium]|jgi:NADH:ubiquinone oxidoreductase subunit F (NADH-binding)/(2Fe-2S) ferredoxin|nr:NADH-quinone oxidoreductase subunit NuoF [Spirochaetia bacterium]